MKIARTIVALGAAASMSIGMFAVPAVAQEDVEPGTGITTENGVLPDDTDPGVDESEQGADVLSVVVESQRATEGDAPGLWVRIYEADAEGNKIEPENELAARFIADDEDSVDFPVLEADGVRGVVEVERGIEDGAPGLWVRIYEADAEGNKIEPENELRATFVIDGTGGGTNIAASAALLDITASSGDSTPQCAAAVATVGIPLLLLPPLALSSQLGFVGLSEITAGLEAQLQDFNTQIQQGTGIFDPETARMIEQVNNALAPYGVNAGQVVGATGLLVVGGLAANHILSNCL